MKPRDAEGASFRPDIQGLRALAVLFVVFYHAGFPFFSGGYIGVDVFFVISGYLISGLLVRELEKTGRIDFVAFYARRMKRLLPAAMLVFFVTAVATRLWLSPLEQMEVAPSLLFSALYVSNIWFASNATDYLAGDVHSQLLIHTWSLSVEEQFYLIWPVLILLGAKLAAPGRIRRALMVAMTALFAVSLGLSLWVMSVSQPWAFFGSPMRAWEFAAGGLAFMATLRIAAWSDRAKTTLMALGFVLMVWAVVFFNDRTRFPGVAAFLPVIGTVLMIVSGTGRGWITRWLGTRVMQTIGDVSYSFYLWHWPILVFSPGGPLGPAERVAGVVLSFLLAWGTYLSVENRVRFSPLLAPSPLRAIALGVCLTLVGAGSAVALRSMAKSLLASPEQARYMHVRNDLPRIYGDGCHLSFSKVDPAECAYGDHAAHRTVVLFGDSHGAQWFPALERIANDRKWRLVSLTKSACPSVWVTPFRPELGRPYVECERWRVAAMRRIADEHPVLVVLANSSNHVETRPEGTNAKDWSGIDVLQWRAGLRRTVDELRHAGAAVVIVRDTPLPGFDVPTCLSKAAWRGKNVGSSCSFDRRTALNAQVFAAEQEAAGNVDRVSVVDLSDLMCGGSSCHALIKGSVAYRDSHHLTAAVSASFAPALLERFGSQLPRVAF